LNTCEELKTSSNEEEGFLAVAAAASKTLT
jgi:hypothetical protein